MTVEKYISVKFIFMKNCNFITVFDSSMEEIATWDPVKGLQGIEQWSMNEQLNIASVCIEVYNSKLENLSESEK